MRKDKYLKDVVTLKLIPERCIGCKMCTIVCPHAVFDIKDKKALIVDRDSCMECGACAKNCPTGAITVRPGVGCAYAIITSILRGKKTTECSCCAK